MISLEGRYQEQIAQIRKLVDTEAITVNVMQGNGGVFFVTHTYGGLGKILRDAGFTKLLHLEGDFLAWEAAQRPQER